MKILAMVKSKEDYNLIFNILNPDPSNPDPFFEVDFSNFLPEKTSYDAIITEFDKHNLNTKIPIVELDNLWNTKDDRVSFPKRIKDFLKNINNKNIAIRPEILEKKKVEIKNLKNNQLILKIHDLDSLDKIQNTLKRYIKIDAINNELILLIFDFLYNVAQYQYVDNFFQITLEFNSLEFNSLEFNSESISIFFPIKSSSIFPTYPNSNYSIKKMENSIEFIFQLSNYL